MQGNIGSVAGNGIDDGPFCDALNFSDLLTFLSLSGPMIRESSHAVRSLALLVLQLTLLFAGLMVMAFAPPAQGTMLLVPLTGDARARLPALAVAHGALLVGRGPIGGSLLVRGDRAILGPALLRQAIVPIAGTDSSCGSAFRNRDKA